jgi:hypothetical protein
MTDKQKLSLINSMISNYYEFCSFDDEGLNAGSLQMLVGSIEAVLAFDAEEECEDDFSFGCSCYPRCDCDCGAKDEEDEGEDGRSVIGVRVYIPKESPTPDQTEVVDELGEAIHELLMRVLEDAED